MGLKKFFKYFPSFYNIFKIKNILIIIVIYESTVSNKVRDFSIFPSPSLPSKPSHSHPSKLPNGTLRIIKVYYTDHLLCSSIINQ